MKKIIEFLKDNYKIFIIYIIILIIMAIPLPYYVYGPGGIIDIDKRIEINNKYDSKGSFNLSFVSEYKGNIFTAIISFFNKNWNMVSSKEILSNNESNEDYYLRDKITMEEAYSNATIVSYKKANKDINILSTKIYVGYLFEESDTDLKIGDQIVKVNGIKVTSKKQVNSIISSYKVGDKIDIDVIYKNKKYKRSAKLISYEDNTIIGIGIMEVNKLKTNPDIKFKYAKDEYGSSGGLMLSLAIYNSLVKEDITNGKTIVGTGTIDVDGNVGEIAGIEYKIKGAIKKKVDLFIVPNANLKEALKVKKDNNYNIKIIGVDTFEEVIDYLNNH